MDEGAEDRNFCRIRFSTLLDVFPQAILAATCFYTLISTTSGATSQEGEFKYGDFFFIYYQNYFELKFMKQGI